MGTDKNIKLHIVTDIKKTSKEILSSWLRLNTTSKRSRWSQHPRTSSTLYYPKHNARHLQSYTSSTTSPASGASTCEKSSSPSKTIMISSPKSSVTFHAWRTFIHSMPIS